MAQGLVKQLHSSFGDCGDCVLLPCDGWDCEALFPSTALTVDGTWWAELHDFLSSQNRAAVLRTADRKGGGAEVMLVPMMGRDPGPAGAGGDEPVFAAFVASLVGGDFVRQMLLDMRLPLVFDLDETLLVAKSQSQLGKELKALRDVRRPALQRATSDPQQKAKLQALEREEQLMLDDLAMLQEFADSDSITYKGKRLQAKPEEAFLDSEQRIMRPVIRLPDNEDTLFTRIEPHAPHSSMVFKLRPNWRAIWAYLSGLLDPATHQAITDKPPSPKLRFSAYVCTAAERGYALEAWRVLDPDGWMIPVDQRKKRVHSGSSKKALAAVLSLGQGRLPGMHGRHASHMPLAVIVDDRVEIWDPSNQGQVLQVEPFRPWEEQAAQDLGLTDTPTMQSLSAQMVRLKDELFNLRMHVFHRTQEVLRCQLDLMRDKPLDLSRPHAHYRSLLAEAPWIEGLLASGRHRVSQPGPLPPELEAAKNKPMDPRMLRAQQAQQQQQQGGMQQGGMQPPQQQQQGPDILSTLAGPQGAALLQSLTAITGMQPGQQQQPQQPLQQPGMLAPVDPRRRPAQQPPQIGMPADPRLQMQQQPQQAGLMASMDPRFQQQQQQQQQPGMPPLLGPPQQQPPTYSLPPQALGPDAQQQQQQRPTRQRPGKMAGGPPGPGQQAMAPGPGVAALQQRMGGAPADPRQRPGPPGGAGPAPAASNAFADALGMISEPQQAQQAAMQQQQQQGPPPRQPRQPGGPQRWVGLHGPAPGQQPAIQQQQQQQQGWNAGGPAAVPPPPGGPPGVRPGMPPGQNMQVQVPGMPRPGSIVMPAPPPGGPAGDDGLRQRWAEAFGGQPAGAQGQPGYGPGSQAGGQGVKRKATGGPEDMNGGGRQHKQVRNDAAAAAEAAAAAAAAPRGPLALSTLFETTHQRQLRLQWSVAQQPDGSWRAAAYVGVWPAQYPPPGMAPTGTGAGPDQQTAMQAAAEAALVQGLPYAAAGGGHGGPGPVAGGRGRGRSPPPGAFASGQPRAGRGAPSGRGQPGPPPYLGNPPAPAQGGGAAINCSTALDSLIGNFPGGTNRIEWQELPPGQDGSARCRLVINSGEFEGVGAAPPDLPGPRGEKRARQLAALAVLQQAGYSVTFEQPGGGGGGGGGGGYGGGPGRGGRGGGGPRRGGGGLDSRHARAAAGQHAVSRDAYLESLHDELG